MSGFRKIDTEELQAGMKVARGVENSYGALLVSAGMILDDNLIKKLKRTGVDQIVIYDESEEQINKNFSSFSEQYQSNINNLKILFNSVEKKREMDYFHVKDIADKAVTMDTNRDIVTMLSVIRDVDEYTYTHSINVGLLAMMFGRWAGLDKVRVKQLLYAGILHDIGKTRVPDEVLNKNGKLTKDEFEVIKLHTVHGYEMVKKCNLLPESVARAVLLHHERNNGIGYPFAFKKEKIPFMARVLAIVDTYDAMTSDRVYKAHRPPFDVFRLFEEDLQSYDFLLAKIFMSNMAQYYLGEVIELEDNQKGEIVYINPSNISRPIISINNEFIDLSESNLKIKEVYVKDQIDENIRKEFEF
ncbi:HD domain-containing phosphohydrolase [Natronospora cellulosivora (SeqCode)]